MRASKRAKTGPINKKQVSFLEEKKDEEMKDLPLVPERERLDVHAFDVGAEHASGWSVKSQNPVKKGDEQDIDPEKNPMNALVLRDAGEVNRVQFERIKELKMPLSENATQNLPVTIRSGNAPDFKSRDQNDQVRLTSRNITEPQEHVPIMWLNEAGKMGLKRTSTEATYNTQERRIRRSDRHVGFMVKDDLSCDYGVLKTAADVSKEAQQKGLGGYGKYSKESHLRSRVRYNPLIVPGQPLAASRFRPFIGPISKERNTEMPGSVAIAFVGRDDTAAGDELEKIVVVNREAFQNTLDHGIFSPEYRNMSQYPPIVRAKLEPTR